MSTNSPLPTQLQDRLEKTWKQLAWQRFSHASRSQTQPQAIMIARPHDDSGSAIADLYRSQFHSCGGCVSINPDDLMLLHPAVAACSKIWSEPLAEYVQSTSAELAAELTASAVEQQNNIVAVCKFECVDAAIGLLGFLRNHHYETTLVVPVVNNQATSNRTESHPNEASFLPFSAVDEKNPQQSNETLLKILDQIEESSSVTRLLLLDQQFQCLLEMNQTNGFTRGRSRAVYGTAMVHAARVPSQNLQTSGIPKQPEAEVPELPRNNHRLPSELSLPPHPGLSRTQHGTAISSIAHHSVATNSDDGSRAVINRDPKTARRREWQKLLRRLADSNQ
jgi:hypothetical protein